MTKSETDFTLKDEVLTFDTEASPFRVTVKGPIIKTDKEQTHDWKVRVACAVRTKRRRIWCPDHQYAVTLQFRFAPRADPSQEGDVDNYIKPVLDGLAAGLFLSDDQDPRDLPREKWNRNTTKELDDSNFRTLLICRLDDLPDGKGVDEEEVCLFVSSREP